jgi:adenosylcobyric acid synthase
MTRAIMLQGTGSDVGKTLLVAGLCRAALRRGIKVRPFKPQNMSNNAAIAIGDDGAPGEIGRAQWLQARACKVAPGVHMNPVLLKPQSDVGAQIVIHGRMAGEAAARNFGDQKDRLMAAVMESWGKVREGADLVIVEGAGSPAEINLRDRDIANMGFAAQAGVPVILVGDIDRGGVIAAIAGTHLILPEEDRAMIAGFIVNKFRGELSLFDDGLAAIERFTGWRSFGVVPWLKEAAMLPAEDAVVLDRAPRGGKGRLTIAVPMLSRIANFDDLDPLRAEPDVDVVFVPPGRPIPPVDIIVLPGSKSTIADLAFLRAQGWDRDIARHHAQGGTIVGLCGGFQMLGRSVSDPAGAEGLARDAPGLGLLDVETVLEPNKTLREATARSCRHGVETSGYEIHLGRTSGPDCARPAFEIDGVQDGAMSSDGRVWGTYVHGLFSGDDFRRRFLAEHGVAASPLGFERRIDDALDAIAEALETRLDCDALFFAAR